MQYSRGLFVGAALVAGLAIAGCASAYRAPTDGGGGFAELILSREMDDVGLPQILFSIQDEACKGRNTMIGSQGSLVHMKKPVTAPAGKPFYMLATSDDPRRAAPPLVPTTDGTCYGVSSFTPEAGHSYEASNTRQPGGCRLMVRDKATGQPPPSLAFHPVSKGCWSYALFRM